MLSTQENKDRWLRETTVALAERLGKDWVVCRRGSTIECSMGCLRFWVSVSDEGEVALYCGDRLQHTFLPSDKVTADMIVEEVTYS